MEDITVYISLIIPVLAGGLLVLYFGKSNARILKLLLSFSGAYLLGISFMHLIPEIYSSGVNNVGLFVLSGFLFQLLLEFFSEGIEHGHVHIHSHGHLERHFPLMIMISLCIHAFVEGIPIEREIHSIHSDHSHNENGQHSLLLGVIFHNIPVSIALMSMFVKSGLNKSQSVFWLVFFALMGPLGTFTGHYLSGQIEIYLSDFLDIVLAIVVGMFLHISTTILFESSEGHRFNFIKLASIIAGVGIAVIH